MGLNHARAVEIRASARATRDGLVILVGRVAEGEVVHRLLARRQHAERTVERIGDAGRGLDIASHHRRRRSRVEHAALGNDHPQRLEATGVERDVVIDQGSEHIEHRGHRHRLRGVEVVRQLGAGAAEIDHRLASGGVDRDLDLDLRAVVHRQGELPVRPERGLGRQRSDHPTHRLLGVVLHMTHVSHHRGQAPLRDHRVQFLHTFLVGRDLGPQIGQRLVRVARRPGTAGKLGTQLGLKKPAVANQQQVVEQHALLVDAARERRHRARRDATDIGVVAAGGYIKRGLTRHATVLPPTRQIDGGDDGDVRQMGAAVVGVVEHVDITRLHVRIARDHGLDRLAHRSQVHRHVRRVGDQRTLGVEQRAGEVQPLLDVDRVCGVLQPQAHLLGDVHEQVVEDLEHHRVGGGADGLRGGAWPNPTQRQRAVGTDLRLPAGLDHRGRVALGDHCRAVEGRAGSQGLALVQCGLAPSIVTAVVLRAVHLHQGQRRRWFGLGFAGSGRWPDFV